MPLLGDIPVAGNLFKNKQRSTNKQEMLVFITPKMIADRAAGALNQFKNQSEEGL